LKRWKTFDFQQLKASPLNPELGARERTRTSISRGGGSEVGGRVRGDP